MFFGVDFWKLFLSFKSDCESVSSCCYGNNPFEKLNDSLFDCFFFNSPNMSVHKEVARKACLINPFYLLLLTKSN